MYKEPDFVTKYWDSLSVRMPKCCHTCSYFEKDDSFCTHFKSTPPEGFAATVNSCQSYFDDIPF
jgi:hypothetical protein